MNSIFLNNFAIHTPSLLASYRIKDFPRAGLRNHPWKMTKTQGLLLNAFDLLANKQTMRFTNEIRECERKLHQYVEFDGPIVLDSGAFNFLQQDTMSISPKQVLDIGLELRADISVVLDHPFPPKAKPKDIQERLKNTQQNTRIMFEALMEQNGAIPPSFQLMPVLHGHDTKTLKKSLNQIKKIWGKEPEIIGIGSLAPLAQNGSKKTAIDIITTVRKLLPNAHIHCFSLGSALLMLFAFYCGADTVDSQTWIMSAAFKQVQLPGFHLTRMSRREKEKNPEKYQKVQRAFANHLLMLIQEEQFILQDWDTGQEWDITDEEEAFEYLRYLEDEEGINHIHRRACHNLYSFNFEAQRVREKKASGNLEAFIEGRIKSTVYKRAFEHAIMRKQQG